MIRQTSHVTRTDGIQYFIAISRLKAPMNYRSKISFRKLNYALKERRLESDGRDGKTASKEVLRTLRKTDFRQFFNRRKLQTTEEKIQTILSRS